MGRGTVYVEFDGSQVAVQSNAPEVLAGLERGYREMLGSARRRMAAHLEVHKIGERYHLLGNTEVAAEGGSLADVLRCVSYEVVLRLIRARPDLLWLHAGAAAHRGRAILFVGPWGQGKSTLVTSLCALGWTYLSDDVVPLDMDLGKVIPFPRTPMVREATRQQMPADRLRDLRKAAVELAPGTVCRGAMSIGALVLPTYSLHSPARMLPCSPSNAALALLRNCLNFMSHRRAAVSYVCELVSRHPAFRLSFPNGELAATLIAQAHGVNVT